jgi:putative transcriptional regulator
MKQRGISSLSLEPDEAPPADDVDWAQIDAMSDEEVEARARSDPDALPLSGEQLARMRRAVPDVRRLRRRLGLTQEEFARIFHLPVGTLRDWEQGRKAPDAPARALLRIIAREPEAARRAMVDG